MAIEVVKNEDHVSLSGSIAGDVRISVLSQMRLIYLGLRDAFGLSEDEIIETFKEAVGEEAGMMMYELGSNAAHDEAVTTVITSLAENSEEYHEFIDDLANSEL